MINLVRTAGSKGRGEVSLRAVIMLRAAAMNVHVVTVFTPSMASGPVHYVDAWDI